MRQYQSHITAKRMPSITNLHGLRCIPRNILNEVATLDAAVVVGKASDLVIVPAGVAGDVAELDEDGV